jgi:hypothetical protein
MALSPGLAAAGQNRRTALAFIVAAAFAGLPVGSFADAAKPHSPRSQTVAQNQQPAAGNTLTTVPAPIEAVQLRALVPARIGAWKRTSVTTPPRRSHGEADEGRSAVARFEQAKQKATLTVADMGGLSAIALPAQWSGEPTERDTDTGSEKIYREGSHTVREWRERASGRREVTFILVNGIVITAASEQADAAALKAVAGGIDLAKAAALRTPPR